MYRYVYLYIYIRFMHILYIHILHMYMIIINHYSHISPGHQPFCVHLGSCPSQVFKKKYQTWIQLVYPIFVWFKPPINTSSTPQAKGPALLRVLSTTQPPAVASSACTDPSPDSEAMGEAKAPQGVRQMDTLSDETT